MQRCADFPNAFLAFHLQFFVATAAAAAADAGESSEDYVSGESDLGDADNEVLDVRSKLQTIFNFSKTKMNKAFPRGIAYCISL